MSHSSTVPAAFSSCSARLAAARKRTPPSSGRLMLRREGRFRREVDSTVNIYEENWIPCHTKTRHWSISTRVNIWSISTRVAHHRKQDSRREGNLLSISTRVNIYAVNIYAAPLYIPVHRLHQKDIRNNFSTCEPCLFCVSTHRDARLTEGHKCRSAVMHHTPISQP